MIGKEHLSCDSRPSNIEPQLLVYPSLAGIPEIQRGHDIIDEVLIASTGCGIILQESTRLPSSGNDRSETDPNQGETRILEPDQNTMKSILVTGAAGFIGHKTTEVLLNRGYIVVGLDNMNDYYDVRLKEHRLDNLKTHKNFKFYRVDIENPDALKDIFDENRPDAVINLAARVGVRDSVRNPLVNVRTNIFGTVNLLEHCKSYGIEKFVASSTSSLYANQRMPFNESLPVNEPISPYAASKKGAELMLYTYHFLYGIDATVLRYFTVYGPAGRPDMSVFRFIKWVDEGIPIEVFGDGTQSRDFTYIDDIAEGTVKACETKTGYEIINLGGNQPHELNYVIELIERYLGKKASRNLKPFHKADLMATWADITKAQDILKWQPKISLEDGIKKTVEWYLDNKDWIKDMIMPV